MKKSLKRFNTKNSLASPTSKENLGWQDNLQERIKTLEYFIESKISFINGLIFRKGGRGLVGILLKYIRGVRPRSTKSVVRQIAGFAFFCSKMARHNGLKGLVIYLKACQVLLQQSVGGFRVIDLGELKVRPARNRAGVPLIIPAGIRVKISRDRDIQSIRFWMTLFGLFRILEFRGKLSLSTIVSTGPSTKAFNTEWEEFLRTKFLPSLQAKYGELPPLGKISLFPIIKSGPTTDSEKGSVNSSAVSLIAAARIWLRFPALISAFKIFSSSMGYKALYYRMKLVALAESKTLDYELTADKTNTKLEFIYSILKLSQMKPYISPALFGHEKFLGKLGFKIEAAGKIRVFAMVDAWTQWLMAPIHRWIFSIIRDVHEDGTFDQLVPIQRLQEKYSDSKKRLFASIDLSAATDRLPISIQQTLLKVVLEGRVPDSDLFSQAWADLLVKRPYKVALPPGFRKDAIIPHNLSYAVYYAVGQPMGALSSWAMLALTHHAMVQFAKHKAYPNSNDWFEDYGILGDDVAIANGKVVYEYRRLLHRLGVKAGLAKSILARGRFVVEFAKKFFVDKTQANMLPIKECIATSVSTSLVVEFVRKYGLNLNQILSFLGFGYKVKSKAVNSTLYNLSTRLRVLLVWLAHPSSPLGKSSYFEWLHMKSWRDSHDPDWDVMDLMIERLEKMANRKVNLIWDAFSKYEDSINNLSSGLDKHAKIEVITSALSRSGELRSHTVPVPWKVILNPKFSSSEGDFWEDSFEEFSSEDLVQQVNEFDEAKVGVSYEEFVKPLSPHLSIIWERTSPPDIRIDELLEFIFEDKLDLVQIPERFWIEYRKELRPFRDFLQVYSLWQDLTKPLWSAYYKDRKVQHVVERTPDDELSLYEDFSKPTVLPFDLNRVTQFDRCDLESQTTIKSSSWSWKGCWPYMKMFGQCLLWLIEWGIFLVICNFVLQLPETAAPVSPIETSVSSTTPSLPVMVMVASSFLLVGLMVGVYCCTGSLAPLYDFNYLGTVSSISYPDMIQGHVLGVQGPLTFGEYEVLQRTLENRALLDNLAISPIGDLWVSPWD